MGTPLLIGPAEVAALHELRVRANTQPVDASTLATRIAPHRGNIHFGLPSQSAISGKALRPVMQFWRDSLLFLRTACVLIPHVNGVCEWRMRTA
jgi:hypothetical protein